MTAREPPDSGNVRNPAETPPADSRFRTQRWMRRAAPGLLLAATAVVVSFGLHWLLPAIPVMSFAVVLGIVAANVPPTSAWIGGAEDRASPSAAGP